MSVKVTKDEALDYHKFPNAGKLAIQTTKKMETQRDLSLAYTPGVAYPCEEIQKNPELAFEYTSKRNLVAVISNGTAVLGLGDIGSDHVSCTVEDGSGSPPSLDDLGLPLQQVHDVGIDLHHGGLKVVAGRVRMTLICRCAIGPDHVRDSDHLAIEIVDLVFIRIQLIIPSCLFYDILLLYIQYVGCNKNGQIFGIVCLWYLL